MDLDFTEEQEMLREMVRGVCTEYASVEVVRAMEDDPVGYPAELWKQMGELGLLGMAIPEQYGGSDQSALEGVVVYEELGRALAPSPHFVSAVMAAGVLTLAGDEDQKREWLPKIASGEAIVTPAWLEPKRGFGPAGVELRAVPDGDEYRLMGVKLLVLARTGEGEGGVDLLLVDPKSPGIELTQQLTLASDTQYKVAFDDVRVPASARIGGPESGWSSWNRVMHEGIILLAAQAMGGADRALEITVEYTKERKQFDKPLGAFQAISHYLADASTEIDGGRTLVYEAAWAHSQSKPIGRLAPMAKLFACQTFRDATAMAVQVWGGVGFTQEYDIQLYFRRAKELQLSWWDTRYLEDLIASEILD
jgi:alkylation response protein AidB-like acyl-CoA dehydrogenase